MTQPEERGIDLAAGASASLTSAERVQDVVDLRDLLTEMTQPEHRDDFPYLLDALIERYAFELNAPAVPPVDVAAIAAVAQKSGLDAGVRAGFAKGKRAGVAEAEAKHPQATVQQIERDASGRAIGIVEQSSEGIRHRAITYDERGKLVRIETVTA